MQNSIQNGRTLLHGSVSEERFDVTNLLLSYGADINITENGETLAHRAATDNNTHLLKILHFHHCRFNA